MKKTTLFLLLALVALLLSACQPAADGSTEDKPPAVNQLAAGPSIDLGPFLHPALGQPILQAAPIKDPPDLDLSHFSGTMVYAEVFNMSVTPKEYLGKTVKLRGQYYGVPVNQGQHIAHLVVVTDQAACCEVSIAVFVAGKESQGFVYPENFTPVEVSGIFGTFELGGAEYPSLVINEMVEYQKNPASLP